ncbi:MAG: hypothetical protein RL335_1557 [Bacteroidota bacterium]
MKRSFLVTLLLIAQISIAQTWQPVGLNIKTNWTTTLNPALPHPEYPRPQMKREHWMNLNGLWDYAIRYKEEGKPAAYSGKILVPFPIESSLSGVGKIVGDQNILWYHRTFSIPVHMKGKRLLLHFGAIDWQSEIYVNGKIAGKHEGGYDPFYIDITSFVSNKTEQDIVIRVWDPSDNGPQPRGKQVTKPSGIWYTAVTGIWQTAWLEAVPETYIHHLYSVADLDAAKISVHAQIKNQQKGDIINIQLHDGNNIISVTENESAHQLLDAKGLIPWSPSKPKLYSLTVSLLRNGSKIDEVKSYTALRKISLKKDENGIQWIELNNQFLFQFGPLDQGWWPDGLYTAPTAEALKFDVIKTKEMGFNMIRKHVKVEPALWYSYCDSLGMLVWQDMPSGDMAPGDRWNQNPSIEPTDKIRTEASEKIYRSELKAMIDAFRAFPSIVIWVPFNEAWGQFKTVDITNWVKQYDPSRLVNPASGGNFHATGDLHDLHNYPEPQMHRPEVFGKDRAVVLGEFGGLGLPVEGHTWTEKSNWGYQTFKNKEELFNRYQQLIDKLTTLIPKGLSAAIYTQTTDVETEVNGLMTYDRKQFKFDPELIRKVNEKLYNVRK